MDVAAAFPSVSRACLLNKLRAAHLDEDLVCWTYSFMRDRRVVMSVDGQDGPPMAVTIGLPQGSPVSPVLFGIYIADVHKAVENRDPGCRGISFVDGVAWFVEGTSIEEVTVGLERCAAQNLLWAESNAVRFETSKTEAILLSKRRSHGKRRACRAIQVGRLNIHFAREATRWLGIWIDSALTLRDSRHRVLNRAKGTEAAIRRLVSKYGVPPASARNLQQALIHGTLLYGAELTWDGSKKMEKEVQLLTNRMGRASLGVWQTTPLGIVMAESALSPARALLEHRFDAEVFALLRAIQNLNERKESDQHYTVFSDSQAAIARITHDGCGPAQALARAAIAQAFEIHSRGNTITIRWTPSHSGIGGNNQAGMAAKSAAANRQSAIDPIFRDEASLSYLKRVTTGTRSNATKDWIRTRVKRKHRYRPPPNGKMRKELSRVPKELAGRYYQLLSAHAATAEHLVRVGQAQNECCWWCGSGEKQSRRHLSIRCKRWMPEIKRLWMRVRADCEWGGPRAPSVRTLFNDPRAIPAVLDFLKDTKVGQMPSQVLLRGGIEVVVEDLEDIELWAEESRAREVEENEEEDGPGPPL